MGDIGYTLVTARDKNISGLENLNKLRTINQTICSFKQLVKENEIELLSKIDEALDLLVTLNDNTSHLNLNVTISAAYGDNLSTLLLSNNYMFIKKSGTSLSVVTSIGSFIIQEDVQSYITSDFSVLFTITSVTVLTGTDLLNTVYIIGNKTR